MHSYTEENYLKALFQLSDEKGETSVHELSRQLGIKMPTVNSMMKKLGEKKLVRYESYKPLRLTEKGKKVAALIIRKHRLTEMFLVEKMGFGWEEVHDIAEQIEHIQSPVFFEKMDKLLDYPKIDPHGSPIPDNNGHIKWMNYHKLSTCKPGQILKLAAVSNATADFLTFLNNRGLKLGLKLKVKSIEAFDGSIVVNYGRNRTATLSFTACTRLLVELGT